MNVNVITLEDLQNKSLDEIIELYSKGYELDSLSHSQEKSDFKSKSVHSLTTPMLDLTLWTVLLAGLAAGATIVILSARKK
jgi:hypothetical protein